MLEHDFRSEVGYWVHQCAHQFERAMNTELAAEGVTYRQCQVLAWLALEKELSQADLARNMRVEPPTIVKVLDRMERDGLIRRKASPHDRRRKMISPTRRAVPVWKRILKCIDHVRKRSISEMPAADVARLRKLLEQVHGNLVSEHGEGCGTTVRTPGRTA